MDYNGDFEYFGPVFARYANTIKKADESNNEVQMRIYPNPVVDGFVSLQLSEDMQNGDVIEIYNYSGQLMRSIVVNTDVKTMRLNIADLPKGMYIIHYVNAHNSTQLSQKLMVR